MRLDIRLGSTWVRRPMSETLIVRGLLGQKLLVEDDRGGLRPISILIFLLLYRPGPEAPPRARVEDFEQSELEGDDPAAAPPPQ